jgi:hypothetical protein
LRETEEDESLEKEESDVAEEQGYEVVDKRRVNADGTPREGPETESAGTEAGSSGGSAPAEEAAATPGGSEALPPITARDLVTIYVNQLQEIAWSRMGLTPNPTSGTIDRDLADARFAIDCVADLVGRLDPLIDPNTRRELHNMLSNLRINFVRQSGKS